MVVQLLFLGIYLNYIFKLNNTYINALYLLFMIGISTHSVIESTFLRDKKIILIVFISVFCPFIGALYIFEGLVLKLENIFDAMYLIPISGMILGNTLNSIMKVSLEDMKDVVAKGNHIFRPQKQKYLYSIDMDKEYIMVQRMMRLADLYRKFEKELPRKNYWEKFLL
mgnify:CR=1 FL=1